MKIHFSIIDLSLPFEVFNLTFGPVNDMGNIDDHVKLGHENIGKLFSTILLQVIQFLKSHPEVAVGIDGSTDSRTYMYHRLFLTNEKYLAAYCDAVGVDWFVKVLRNGELEEHESGAFLARPRFEIIPKDGKRAALFRYYLLRIIKTIF